MEIFIFHFFVSIIFSCIVFIFVFPISMATAKVEERHNNISSLKMETITQGSFFLGAGKVSGNPHYFVMKKLGDNVYYLETYNAYKTIIVEDDNVHPQVTTRYKVSKITWYSIVFASKDIDYTIYVPKGTVIKEFSTR